MMDLFRRQAARFGTQILTEDVESVNLGVYPFIVEAKSGKVEAEAIIISTGATAKRLDIPGCGDKEFWQKRRHRLRRLRREHAHLPQQALYVIGAGDTAIEQAFFLTKFGSKVFIVHRRDEFRASKIMGDRAVQHPKIEVLWSHVVSKVEGDGVVRSVIVKDLKTGKETKREAARSLLCHWPRAQHLLFGRPGAKTSPTRIY